MTMTKRTGATYVNLTIIARNLGHVRLTSNSRVLTTLVTTLAAVRIESLGV
jgi:hypothetical protein